MEAAELVAFDIFSPVLRSRGNSSEDALRLYQKESFRKEIISILKGNASGEIIIPSLEEVLEKIDSIDDRLSKIEKLLLKNTDNV